MIDGVTNTEGLSVLERLVQFAGQRHRLIVNNIANFDTPGYRPVDISPAQFQQQLGQAIDRRRAEGRPDAPLERGDTLQPTAVGGNILFHDANDRDLDRTMKDLVENFLTFRLAGELMRNRLDLVNSIIAERI